MSQATTTNLTTKCIDRDTRTYI